MKEQFSETTDEGTAAAGRRSMSYVITDAADELKIEIGLIISRREEVSLHDESPRYEATGNTAFNGQLADALIRIATRLNEHRQLTTLPK